MNLTITDYTGTISTNPALWPDELKQAVAKCCCGGTSSVAATYPITCCPSVMLPESFSITIGGTSCHNGSYPVNIKLTAPTLPPLADFWQHVGAYVWMSDIYEESTCSSVELFHLFNCVANRHHTYTLYSVVVFDSACVIKLYQFIKHDYFDTAVSGDCAGQISSGTEYLWKDGFGTINRVMATQKLECGILQCNPFQLKYPLLSYRTIAGILCNFACTSGGLIGFTGDKEAGASCVNGEIVGPYAEIKL